MVTKSTYLNAPPQLLYTVSGKDDHSQLCRHFSLFQRSQHQINIYCMHRSCLHINIGFSLQHIFEFPFPAACCNPTVLKHHSSTAHFGTWVVLIALCDVRSFPLWGQGIKISRFVYCSFPVGRLFLYFSVNFHRERQASASGEIFLIFLLSSIPCLVLIERRRSF